MQPLVQARRTRDDVLDALRGLIRRGEFNGGSRLDEVDLATRMGVSRTPVREALITLEVEGWVKAIPNRGVRVIAADETMVAELYPILAALESEAVRSGGQSLIASVPDLREINARLAKEKRRSKQHQLDAAFHRRLGLASGNPRLRQLIETHWLMSARFDGAGQRGTANQQGSCDEHGEIIDALERGDIEGAAILLRRHWLNGIAVVTAWLRS